LPPDVQPGGALFDPFTSPVPEEVIRRERDAKARRKQLDEAASVQEHERKPGDRARRSGAGSTGTEGGEPQGETARFDDLTTALEIGSETSTQLSPATRRRSPVLPEPEVRRPAPRARRPAPPARPGLRRVKRTIKRVDPLTVLRLSLFYYCFLLVLWLLVVAVLFFFVQSTGLFDKIEKVGNAFAEEIQLNISLGFVEKWAFLVGLTLVIIGSLLNAFLAFLYNLASDIVGGVELTFVEKDL
jgi:hypothetical protein